MPQLRITPKDTADVIRAPHMLSNQLEWEQFLPNAPPLKLTNKIPCAIPLAKMATRPLQQRRVQRTVMRTSVLPGLQHAFAPLNLMATAAGGTAEMDTKTRVAHAFARQPRVLVTGIQGVLVSVWIAETSHFPTAFATRAARVRRTMLDLSVGAMSALRITSGVEWAFAPLTGVRVYSTTLWSALRPVYSLGQLRSVFYPGA